MKQVIIFSLGFSLLLVSCGDNSPFDEDYWEDPQIRAQDDDDTEEEVTTYSSDLSPLSPNVANVSGRVDITVNATDVNYAITLSEIPHSLIIAEKSITTQTCEEISLNSPVPVITNNSGEFKDLNISEAGSREALIFDLNLENPQNGSSIDLNGRRFVVKAFINTINSPLPQNTSVIPIACGTLARSTVEGGTGGTTGGTTIGGTVAGGTIGGATVGGTGGVIGGTIGGTVGGIDGTIGGGATGGTIGTIGGGTTGGIGGGIGGIDGNIGGVVGGTIGGTGATTGF